MSQGTSTNVSISSLLDSNSSSTNTALPNVKKLQSRISDKRQTHTPIQQLVSQYQTSFDPDAKPANGANIPNSLFLPLKPQNNPSTNVKGNVIVGANNSKSRSLSLSPSPSISAQVKKFQTKFQLEPVASPQPKSKTSINSIINLDDDVSPAPLTASQSADILKSHSLTKRKKPNTLNSSNESKKRKPNSPDLQNSPNIVSKPNLPQLRALKESEAVHTSKGDSGKKLPKADLNAARASSKPVKLAAPTVIDLLNPDDGEDIAPATSVASFSVVDKVDKIKEKPAEKTTKEKEREKPEVPIVALNIPLLDPKDPQPGKAEVVVNVLKLAEDKYGWSVMHPKAKSAIDVIDDMIDDEDDDDEDDDLGDDQEKAPQQNNSVLPVAPRGKELTEEQLVRQHEIKMIRKVGKYDFEDPFIDDVELQMEEDISSTKEGFFVYWGPLVDDRSSGKKKKK